MNFSAWVLTIVGVVFLTLIVDIILPDGETNKYVKSIFAIVTVLVIAAPIPKLLNSDFDMSNIFGEEDSVLVDASYLEQIFQKKCDVYESQLQAELTESGISGVEFFFSADVDGTSYTVGGVSVDMKNVVIQDEYQHINASEKILELLVNVVGLTRQKVVFL